MNYTDTMIIAARNLLNAVNDGKLSHCTASELADIAGDIKAASDMLAAALKPIREVLLTEGEVIGSHYRTLAVETERRTLDTKRVKTELGEQWYNERTTSTAVASLRITALKPHEVRNA